MFDVRIVLDSSTCLFCVVRFLFKKKCLRSLTSTSKKLSPSFWCTITLKSIALQGLFIDSLWNAHTDRKYYISEYDQYIHGI